MSTYYVPGLGHVVNRQALMSSLQSCKVGTIITPTSQRRKLRPERGSHLSLR